MEWIWCDVCFRLNSHIVRFLERRKKKSTTLRNGAANNSELDDGCDATAVLLKKGAISACLPFWFNFAKQKNTSWAYREKKAVDLNTFVCVRQPTTTGNHRCWWWTSCFVPTPTSCPSPRPVWESWSQVTSPREPVSPWPLGCSSLR